MLSAALTSVASARVCERIAGGLLLVLLLTGCATGRYPVATSSPDTATDAQSLESSYIDELNEHVVRVFAQSDAEADEQVALKMATHKGRQANPYLGTAITAVATYDYEERKKLLPIWTALTDFTERQAGRAMADSTQLEGFYADNPDAAQALAQFIIDRFLDVGIFVNLTVTPVTPKFLLPLGNERVQPGVDATAALQDVFGPDVSPQSLSLRVINSGAVDDIYFAGLTMGSVAVLNKPLIKGLAELYDVSFDDTEEVIAANEAAHLVLAERYGPVRTRNWPVNKLNVIADSPFWVDAIHVEEFLSDAVSIRTNPVGPLIAYNSLLSNSVRTANDGSRRGNIESRYGYTAEFFLKSMEAAEVLAGIPEAERQAAALREAGSLGGVTAMGLVARRPDPRVVAYIQQAYLEMSHRFLNAIDNP